MSPTADWSQAHSAHDHCWEDASTATPAVRAAVDQRIAEVRDLAVTLPARIEEVLATAEDDGGRLDHLAHALANLNSAVLHLDDIAGC